jgi:hypothetical protein
MRDDLALSNIKNEKFGYDMYITDSNEARRYCKLYYYISFPKSELCQYMRLNIFLY